MSINFTSIDNRDKNTLQGEIKKNTNYKVKDFPPSQELSDGLGKILFLATNCSLSKELENEIATLRKLFYKFRPKQCFRKLPAVLLSNEILPNLSIKELEINRRVSKKWHRLCSFAQVKAINQKQLKLKEAFPGLNAPEIIDKLIDDRQTAKSLLYANFEGVEGVDNDCLKILTINCPNLKHLLIPKCDIKEDALKYLYYTKDLKCLNIWGCRKLNADSLKYLVHTKQLENLIVKWCRQLEPDALKHLVHTPQLQSLEITGCRHLEKDALKHLTHTKQLKNLKMGWLRQLENDALKHLVHAQFLEHLFIAKCHQLEPDALKHLKHTKSLLNLNIAWCEQLEADSLKHLIHTPNLICININICYHIDTKKIPSELKDLIILPLSRA